MAANSALAGVALAYLESFIEPFGTLWFIYLLPIFFVVTKLVRSVPPVVDLGHCRGCWKSRRSTTGWTVIDEFAGRFVYFYTGYCWRRTSSRSPRCGRPSRSGAALACLAVWAVVNGLLVAAGYADMPVVSLALGVAGAAAVVVGGGAAGEVRCVRVRSATAARTRS